MICFYECKPEIIAKDMYLTFAQVNVLESLWRWFVKLEASDFILENKLKGAYAIKSSVVRDVSETDPRQTPR